MDESNADVVINMSSDDAAAMRERLERHPAFALHELTESLVNEIFVGFAMGMYLEHKDHNATLRQQLLRVYKYLIFTDPARIVGKNEPKQSEIGGYQKRDWKTIEASQKRAAEERERAESSIHLPTD